MRIKHVTPIIVKRYLNENTRKRPVFLRGPSGIGKSEVVMQAAQILGEHVEDWRGVVDIRLAQCDPTDLRGVPFINANGRTEWGLPEILPYEGAGILFLDEITSAPPAIQAAAYQLTLTPEDFGIPKGWMVVCAGNNKSDRGVTFSMAAPLQNRVCDISVNTTLDDFIEHAVACNVHSAVTSFLMDRADMLHKFEPKGEVRAFPSPRAWFAVSSTLELDVPVADRLEMVIGDVGEEAATLFETHLRVYESMPRISDILDGKDVPVPREMNVRYCVAMGLAARVDKNNFGNAWKFLEKMPGDMQTMVVKLAYKRDRTLTQSPAYTKWAMENQDAFRKV